ncbi:MAG: hypothetical protein D6805_01700 [Planctomycetota bacterium]|nr:MAG: hypothetical protein D6805_01700 [Planctomycetota bacterium]
MSRAAKIVLFLLALAMFISSLLLEVDYTHTEILKKMKMLVIQLAVILFAAKLMGEFFIKFLKQPAVLGELLAGVIIGPFALGSIELPILHSPLFPKYPDFPVSPELYGVATVASIILLFLAGLETDFQQFLKQSLTGTLVGIGGVLGAFVFGNLITVWFGLAPKGFMDPVALFMGTISVATSVGITARVLSEQKQLDSPEGTSILAGAVIDDVLGILILAVVVGMVSAEGVMGGPKEKELKELMDKAVYAHKKHDYVQSAEIHQTLAKEYQNLEKARQRTLQERPKKAQEEHHVDWKQVGLIGYKAFGFWLGITIVGIILAGRISWFLKLFNQGTMMALGLALALLISGLAESVGLAAIIGAYAIGLALSKERISDELEHAFQGLYNCFVPVFFAVMGMLVDIPKMLDTSILTYSIVFTVVAIFVKVLGCGLPSYLTGFNTKGALRIGVGMLPRGEVALIVAGVGLASGVISQSMFGVAVAMTLITTLIAPPVLVKIFDDTPGRYKDMGGKEEKVSSAPGPVLSLDDVEPSLVYPCFHYISIALEEKGYETKMLSHRPDHIYQASKGDITMEIREKSSQILFDFPEESKSEIQDILKEALKRLRADIGQLKPRNIGKEEDGKKEN